MALPLEDNESLSDEYEHPEGYEEALAYLKGVRTESQVTPHMVKSKNLGGLGEGVVLS
jgi:hypothetical protein